MCIIIKIHRCLRTKRTDGTNTYQYYYCDGDLVSMSYNGSNMYFSYTPDSLPYTIVYQGVQYLYITNLQGDVTAIITTAGEVVVEYAYDAWGNVIDITASDGYEDLANDNPLRYRGYTYDRETQLYYLQSRYYDPELGRFINADGLISTGQGITGNNMYAYCGNNPISNTDSSGALFFTALGAATGFIGGFVTAAISNAVFGTNIDAVSAGIHGAAGGAIAGAGIDAALLIVGTFGTALPAVALAGGVAFLAGGIGNAYTTYATSGGTASNEQLNYSFAVGGFANLVSLGTSWGAQATSVEGLLISGGSQLKNNFLTGTGIAIGTSAATALGTTNNPTKGLSTAPSNVGYSNTMNNKLWLMEKRMGHR